MIFSQHMHRIHLFNHPQIFRCAAVTRNYPVGRATNSYIKVRTVPHSVPKVMQP